MESHTEQIVRLAPLIRRMASRLRNQVDPDDLAQEALLELLQADAGHTDSWYLTRAKWAFSAVMRSPRYRHESSPDALAESATNSDAPQSATLTLAEFSKDAQTVALMRWAGATARETRQAVGSFNEPFARHELRKLLR